MRRLNRSRTTLLRGKPTGYAQGAEVLRRYHLLADQTSDIVLLIGADGFVKEANPAALRAYGYTREELLSLKDDGPRPAAIRDRELQQTDTSLLERTRYDTIHKRKDGSTFPVEISVSKVQLQAGPMYMCIVRDVTQRKLHESLRELLGDASHRLLRREPAGTVAGHVCERLRSLLDLSLVVIARKDPGGTVAVVAHAGAEAPDVAFLPMRWDSGYGTETPTGSAIATGTPRRMLASDPSAPSPWRSLVEAKGLRGALALPLTRQGETVGAISCYTANDGIFQEPLCGELVWWAEQLSLSLTTAQAQEQNRLQHAALEAAANAVVITTIEGRIVWANPAFTKLTQYALEEVVGRDLSMLRPHHPRYHPPVWGGLLSGRSWHGEGEARRKDGSLYVEEETITPVLDESGETSHLIVIKQDITERCTREQHLRFLETHDSLTCLPNRYALIRQIRSAAATCSESDQIALLVLDLDGLRAVNDLHGAAGREIILCTVGTLAGRLLRKEDLLVHFGGVRFAVLLQGVSAAAARQLAESIREDIAGHRFSLDGDPVTIGASVGVACSRGPAETRNLLAMADTALCMARELGRNRVAVLGPEALNPTALQPYSHRGGRIRSALELGRFRLLFQPIVPLQTNGPPQYEALIRMLDENGAVHTPDSFLPAAERLGLMGDIDEWVVSTALRYLSENLDLRLFVNLAGQTLNDQMMLDRLEALVRGMPDVAGRLAFEVTETTAIRDLSATSGWMTRLRSVGCRFALDDFGMGFSSFAYLRNLPVDLVKVDGSFVHNIDCDPHNLAVVKAISTAAHALDKEVVAEGVESQAVADLLTGLGVEYGQGYYWSPPLANDPPSGRFFTLSLQGAPGS